MTVSTTKTLQELYRGTAALTAKVISSDAFMVIEGHEDIALLIKQFPWPELSPGGEIEVPMPLGVTRWQAQQVKIAQQGQLSFMETEAGHIQKFLEDVVAGGGTFNARMYEGSLTEPKRTAKVVDCFFQSDNPDRDWENRAQIMLVSGTLFFHYLGEA